MARQVASLEADSVAARRQTKRKRLNVQKVTGTFETQGFQVGVGLVFAVRRRS